MGANRRYMPRDIPPPTMGELRAIGMPVQVSCRCGRQVVDPITCYPGPADHETTEQVLRRLRCMACGKRQVGSFAPPTRAWVAYLRLTGQRRRLTYIAALMDESEDEAIRDAGWQRPGNN